MAEEQAVSGTCYLKVDGRQYALAGDITVAPSSVQREEKIGLSGVNGYKVTPKAPSVKAKLSDSGGLSITDLDGITNATVQVELINGKRYVLQNAWTAGAHELDAAEGEVEVTFTGLRCRELTT